MTMVSFAMKKIALIKKTARFVEIFFNDYNKLFEKRLKMRLPLSLYLFPFNAYHFNVFAMRIRHSRKHFQMNLK